MTHKPISDEEIKEYCHNKTNEELRYIVKDCHDSVRAMPENKKIIYYLHLASGVERILLCRERLTRFRQIQKQHIHDSLKLPVKFRKRIREVNGDPYTKDRCFTAMWMLAGYNRYGLI
jgi:hypothetical protein